jgi:hypothetical protein
MSIDATGWPTPLTALVLLVVVWAFRRSTKRLAGPAGPCQAPDGAA